SNGRKFATLVTVGQALREVGADSEARAVIEEAYNKETDAAMKQAAAGVRAVLYKDLDDEIDWRRRSNLSNPHDKASLSTALGKQAMREGKNEEAAGHLREAIAAYTAMKEDATSLNNGALAYLTLYQLTSDGEALTRAGEMLEKAVSLQPGDSILISNAAHSILAAALRDVAGPALDLKVLKADGKIEW